MSPLAVRRLGLGAVSVAFATLAWVLVATAWLCDDAYITFRTVTNFVHGQGLTWNVDERVQAYTHPLWMLLLALLHLLTRELYFTPLLLSLLLSLAVGGVLALRVARSQGAALTGLCLLIGSRSFVDFSSSGLENPLAHLLLLLLFLELTGAEAAPRARRAGLLCAGILLLRTDLLLLVLAPLGLWLWPRAGRAERLRAFLTGLAPLALWHAFTLFYYGAPVPNTAYAKLSTGLGPAQLVPQGLVYLRESLGFDALTLVSLAAGCVASAWLGWRERAFALGTLLYLGYVVSIGGDFMSGRFLSVEFVVAVALLVRALERLRPARRFLAALPALALGLLAPYPNLTSGADYGLERGNDFRDLRRAAEAFIGADGISDERGWHYRLTGLLRVRREDGRFVLPLFEHPKYKEVQRLQASGEKVLTTGAIGLRGYFLGPDVHIIDQNALADPLLARLALADPEDWRISHFRRPIPCGYVESVASGENHLRDPGLARVYDALRLVTRGPLWSGARLAEIVRLNTGHYRAELAGYRNDEGCP